MNAVHDNGRIDVSAIFPVCGNLREKHCSVSIRHGDIRAKLMSADAELLRCYAKMR